MKISIILGKGKVMGKEMKKVRVSWGQAYKDSQKND